jgi:dimethylhistidine N-methyltransferase
VFYDARGSAIYEEITDLAVYYPTRAETEALLQHADAMVDALGDGRPVSVVELGAGTALKSVILLRALHARGATTFVPVDVSPTALSLACERVAREVPGVQVHAIVSAHEPALAALPPHDGQRLLLFLGSSIGNYEDPAAIALLRHMRHAMRAGDALLLGTDLRKDIPTLLAAYDDPQGVTARFNLNALVRINRELGGHFEVGRFRHQALWNEEASRIEMHLMSLGRQQVRIDALDLVCTFEDGETIHTENSIKYDTAHVDRLLEPAGLVRQASFHDAGHRVAVHLIRPG